MTPKLPGASVMLSAPDDLQKPICKYCGLEFTRNFNLKRYLHNKHGVEITDTSSLYVGESIFSRHWESTADGC